MRTILHSFGLTSDSRALGARLNFTDVIEPADIFNPVADRGKLDAANAYGLKLWLDISRYVRERGNTRWDAAFSAWKGGVASHAALAGVFVYGDPECEMDTPGGYIAVVQDLHLAGMRTAATFSHRVLNANVGAAWLNYCTNEGIGVYTRWAGDGQAAGVTDAASTISAFASALAATGRSNTTQKWVFLQGFTDNEWGNTGVNAPPAKEDYAAVLALASGWDAGYFGLAPAPADINRIKTLGLNQSLHDEVAFANAAALGRPFVYPSRAMVRCGETFAFKCSVPGAVWSVEGVSDAEAYATGVIRAGQQTDAAIVRATIGAQTATANMFICRED